MSKAIDEFLAKHWLLVLGGFVALAIGFLAFAFLSVSPDAVQAPASEIAEVDEPVTIDSEPALSAYATESAAPTSAPAEPKIYSDAFATAVAELGLPIIEKRDPDVSCTNVPTENKAISAYEICDGSIIPDCRPAHDRHCKAEPSFINGQLKSVTYVFDIGNVDYPALKASLDKRFGFSKLDVKPRLYNPMGSWMDGAIAEWRSSKIKIVMMKFRGVNVNGEAYHNVSLIVSDRSLPDPSAS